MSLWTELYPPKFHLHSSSLLLIGTVMHLYKHMDYFLYSSFMPIIFLIERIHNDFKVGNKVPTKVNCVHIEKTILTLCLNASRYLPRIPPKLDALVVEPHNCPLTAVEAAANQLLVGLQVLLKEHYPAAFKIVVLVRECDGAGRDRGTPKNALVVLESCLLVMLFLMGTQWENVEALKMLVNALVTWQCWHSRMPSGINNEEYGEAVLSRLRTSCRVWGTIMSLSGTSEVFVTLA